jgi:hypothetical protein
MLDGGKLICFVSEGDGDRAAAFSNCSFWDEQLGISVYPHWIVLAVTLLFGISPAVVVRYFSGEILLEDKMCFGHGRPAASFVIDVVLAMSGSNAAFVDPWPYIPLRASARGTVARLHGV